MSALLENLRRDMRMRVESDEIMSSAWLLIYLIPIINIVLMILAVVIAPAIGIATFAIMGIAVFFSIMSFIVSIILIYKLVKRRNTHFSRQIFLCEDALNLLKEIASKKGVSVDNELATLERTLREQRMEETEKSAVLWAILSAIIMLASWYVYYFLMKDFYRHERRQDAFFEDFSRTLDKCGVKYSPPRRMKPIPDRSFVLYLILSIITLGIFGIYWLYILLTDPNEHFKHHVELEEEMLKVVETAIV